MLAELIRPGARWTLVGGKGGVGKTTTAAALAVEFAGRGERTLALSVDPAHSLGDALGVVLGPEPRGVPGAGPLEACEVDAEHERARFLGRHREALRALLEEGTYLARDEVEEFLGLAVPGADELAAALRLATLVDGGEYHRVVVDTAPTGHTLRLLDVPRLLDSWLEALRALEARPAAVAEAFGGSLPPALRSGLADTLAAEVGALGRALTDPGHTRFVLVTTAEPVVAAETERLLGALAGAGVAAGGVVVNRAGAGPPPRALPAAPDAGPALAVVYLPLLPTDPRGPTALLRLAAAASATPPSAPAPPDGGAGGAVRVGGRFLPPTDRRLYLVGGKGGVGKSTVASALALVLAEEQRRGRVLLLGTDPAGSLGDVWEVPVGGEARPAPGAAGLELRQLDAGGAWEVFRGAHGHETRRLLGTLLEGTAGTAGAGAAARLADVAPPGLDELMALAEVVDLVGDGAYNALVLDTAPTGHLLRLLEMPQLALDWAHSLMRLLLRYRDAVGLGEAAERLLSFTRDVRRLSDLLRDRQATWVGVVALPEALGVAETARLIPRLRSLGMPADALLVNRLLGPDAAAPPRLHPSVEALLGAAAGVPAAGTPAADTGPRGAEALRRFAAGWRVLALQRS